MRKDKASRMSMTTQKTNPVTVLIGLNWRIGSTDHKSEICIGVTHRPIAVICNLALVDHRNKEPSGG